MLHRVWDEFDYRVDVYRVTQGAHVEGLWFNTRETWTVTAADGVHCARVRWEINFLLTFETAPFFCVYPVYIWCLWWPVMSIEPNGKKCSLSGCVYCAVWIEFVRKCLRRHREKLYITPPHPSPVITC
jgi:hypothetical protein